MIRFLFSECQQMTEAYNGVPVYQLTNQRRMMVTLKILIMFTQLPISALVQKIPSSTVSPLYKKNHCSPFTDTGLIEMSQSWQGNWFHEKDFDGKSLGGVLSKLWSENNVTYSKSRLYCKKEKLYAVVL